MSFPTLVYKCPGNHKRRGGTYSYKPIRQQAELDEAISNGWHESLDNAIKAFDVKPRKRGRPKR
jgi:hypothetical protein